MRRRQLRTAYHEMLVRGNDALDRAAAEESLLELVADGKAVRAPLGDDALWRAA
jgi:hypothetical protein